MVAVAQSVRALDCGSRGCGFNSRQPVLRSVAQLVEHRSPKPGVAGSIPAGPVRAAPNGAALSVPGNLCRRRSPAARDMTGRLLPGLAVVFTPLTVASASLFGPNHIH